MQGVPALGGIKLRWGGKNKSFSSFKRQYLEMVGYTAKVTINHQQEVTCTFD